MPATANIKSLLFATHGGFYLIGIVGTLLGPILPLLSHRWQLNDEQAGYLFTAQSSGGLIGALCSGWLIRRFGFGPLLVAGFALISIAYGLIGFVGWAAGYSCLFVTGLGVGLTVPTINLLTSELNPDRRAAALNLVNFVWGLGAISSPLGVALLIRDGELRGPLLGLSALLAGLSIFVRLKRPAGSKLDEDPSNSPPIESPRRGWLKPYALMTGALIFLYSGTEAATGGWLATYMRRMPGEGGSRWWLTQSFFWAGLLAGRSGAPFVLRRWSEERLILSGLMAALGGFSLILLGYSPLLISAGAGLTGLGLAPIFPTTIALFTQHYGRQSMRMTPRLFVLASLGGACLPWLVGYFSMRAGALRLGLLTLCVSTLLMIALQTALWREKKHPTSSPIGRDY
jgi:fucose permease